MNLHLMKNRQPLKKLKNGEPMRYTTETKQHCKASQIEVAREAAIANINLIYDALSAIGSTTAVTGPSSADLHNSNGAGVTCEQIDLTVRDCLTDAVEDVSWLLSTCPNPSPELLRIQARFLLALLDEPKDTPLGALAYAVATSVSYAAEATTRGDQKPSVSAALAEQASSIKLKSGN